MYFESTELSKLLYGCVALGIILVLIAALGWILVYYGGYRTIGVFLVATGVVGANLCIVAFWILRLVYRKKGRSRGRSLKSK